MSEIIRVAVSGALGRMGSEVVAAVAAAPDMEVVVQADQGDDLTALLAGGGAQALVDFSTPAGVMRNIEIALDAGAVPIVGTTGLGPAELMRVRELCRSANIGALIAPNFAVGAVLMMRFAAEAARFMPDAEIVEMHHDRKLDSPSGTAAKTAEMIAEGREGAKPAAAPEGSFEKIAGARGGSAAGDVRIHSVRLPGFVASQMVIFGGLGQTLTIRHDSLDRKSFMPGVLLAIRKAPELAANGGEVVYGLENLLF
jgi:4-hydroxy-tetrahydrodipicolinate reductase